MKAFLFNILKLTILTTLVLTLSLFFVPDKVAQSSILAGLLDKHAILKNNKSEKIILLGGSNVSFGVNSERLEAKFDKPVINMGINVGIGLEYIVNDIKPFINKGDLIILIPEYENFYTDIFYGEMELVQVIFDVEPKSKRFLNYKQWQHILKYLPTYSAKKIKNYIPTLFNKKSHLVDIYHRYSFNKYGDAYIHWDMANQSYLPALQNKGDEQINKDVIPFLKEFNLFVENKEAQLMIFPPVIDSSSFENQKIIITKIAEELKKNDIAFVTKPIAYKYENSLFFNSYYHLNKIGVEKRTSQLIHDLDSLKSE